MDYLDLIFRWLHIFGGIFLVGGLFYQRLTLQIPDNSESQRQARRAWSIVVMVCSAALLISGLVNTARISMQYDLPAFYHAALGVKILLALVVMFLAARLAGRSEGAERARQNGKMLLNLTLVCAIALVALASAMKCIDHRPKDSPPPAVSQNAISNLPIY